MQRLLLLLLSGGCEDGKEAASDASPAGGEQDEAGTAPIDARARAGGSAADAGAADGGLLYAQASARLSQIRPRKTIVAFEVEDNDLDAATSWWPVVGSATFRTTTEGVDLTVLLEHCRGAYGYVVRIYDEPDCSAIVEGSAPWREMRGEIAPRALCVGAPGARLFHSRLKTEPGSWTLGPPAASSVIGRAVVVLDVETEEPLACGTVEVAAGAALAGASAPHLQPPAEAVAQLAGSCLYQQIAAASRSQGAPPDCPNLEKLAACATTHHCVADCLTPCADHIACLERSEVCSSACEPSSACDQCMAAASHCTGGFCEELIACAPPPTPGGPCTELRECCMRQGPLVESCLDFTRLVERWSGDTSCFGTLHDWDFNTNFAYRSPCTDGGAASELGGP